MTAEGTKYRVVDLFAGAGGLSYGFLQTGVFEVKAAFENNPNARKTYSRNHGSAIVYGDVAEALTEETKNSLGQIDVVIGGPPCQGFSNANRQKNHAVSQNNSLVKKFVQAVLHLDPAAFVMENVSMLKSDTHRFYVDANDGGIIEQYSIAVKPTEIPLLDSAYLFNGIEGIVADEAAIRRYLRDEEDYLVLNVIFKARNNTKKLISALDKHKKKLLALAESLIEQQDDDDPIMRCGGSAGAAIKQYFGECTAANAEGLYRALEAPVMYQRMLSKAREIHDNEIVVSAFTQTQAHGLTAEVRSMSVIDYIDAVLGAAGSEYSIAKGVLSAAAFGAPQKRMRFVIIGVKKDKAAHVTLPIGNFTEDAFRTVKDAISDIESVEVSTQVSEGEAGIALPAAPRHISSLGRQLRNAERLFNHVSTATTPEALNRFKAIKQGANFHSLDASLKTSYSDPTRTQNTIYLRLNYNEPSGTVMNVRKSMWIHPVLHRALSIREAARLQTFPDSFVFYGPKDAQYQQVGNAVPPILARAIAEHLHMYLNGEIANG